jgi:hypothetical protein
MIENNELHGMLVILKFHYGKRGSINPIISKTMGRVAVINHTYQAAMPQPGTFWLCRIDKEISNPEKQSGCFIVTPVREIPIDDIRKLIPGAYDIEIRNQIVICKPKVPEIYWLMPFSIKKYYIKKDKAKVCYEAVVVPLQYSQVSAEALKSEIKTA